MSAAPAAVAASAERQRHLDGGVEERPRQRRQWRRHHVEEARVRHHDVPPLGLLAEHAARERQHVVEQPALPDLLRDRGVEDEVAPAIERGQRGGQPGHEAGHARRHGAGRQRRAGPLVEGGSECGQQRSRRGDRREPHGQGRGQQGIAGERQRTGHGHGQPRKGRAAPLHARGRERQRQQQRGRGERERHAGRGQGASADDAHAVQPHGRVRARELEAQPRPPAPA